ncbi:MAG: hypothetical protein K2V38_16950, partial [Gemmataceae bacterium]|nr:hypothetical protein [Gemmataceae bacterium]
VFWLTSAVAAPVLVGGRARWQFGVTAGLFAFALGGAALLEWLPVLNLFRVPTRMLLVAAFPLAFLAGSTTHALVSSQWAIENRSGIARGFRRVAIYLGLPTIIGLWFADGRAWWAFVVYWVGVVVSLPLFLRALQNQTSHASTRAGLWLVVLLIDLVTPVAMFPEVKPQAELYPLSPMPEYIKNIQQPTRILDWDVGNSESRASILGIGAPQSMIHSIPTPRGYNPLDVRHYREFLAFVVDDPAPVRGNSPYAQQVMPNFEVGNQRLFDLLCVTHFAAPQDAPLPPGVWREVRSDETPPAPPPLMPNAPTTLPPHILREAAKPHARAWIVPQTERMSSEPLESLKACDFARVVLVSSDSALSQPEDAKPGTARIIESGANRVRVELDGSAGWLVLSDVWFP